MMSNGRSDAMRFSRPRELPVIRKFGRSCALALLAAVLGASAARAATVGDLAPDFALPAAAGGNVRLSEHRGEVVLLTFWSSRCAEIGRAHV